MVSGNRERSPHGSGSRKRDPNPCVILPKSSPYQRTTFQEKVLGQSTILKLLLQLEEGHFSPLKAPPALDRLQGNFLGMLQAEKQLGSRGEKLCHPRNTCEGHNTEKHCSPEILSEDYRMILFPIPYPTTTTMY